MRLQPAVLSLCLAPALALAQMQVVGDGACPEFAVDIAAFATCDGDRVAAPAAAAPMRVAALSPQQVPAHKRTDGDLYVSAVEAQRLRQAYPGAVVLIDIRSYVEAAFVGQPDVVDIHVPFLEVVLPSPANVAAAGIRLQRNPRFVEEVRSALARLDGPREPTILLLCRSGQRSAVAADVLAAAGVPHVYTVIDGFEGDLGVDGRRDVNGWKNVGTGWQQATPSARLTQAAVH